jgi:thioredoxin reductase (NADPH)
LVAKCDVVIVGSGAAGLAAGIYTSRMGLKTLILGEILGGQASAAATIENYPGVETITGIELAETMMRQATNFGAVLKMPEKVISLHLDGGARRVKSVNDEYEAKAIILATGATHKKLNVKGEEEFRGKGVSYCATCDGPFFRNRAVAVVGGGNAAVTEALYLSTIASKVHLIHKRDKLRADKAHASKIAKSGVNILWNMEVKEVLGDKFVNGLSLTNNRTLQDFVIDVRGVFISIGHKPESALAKNAGIAVDEHDLILINMKQETNIPGVFAAGDVCSSVRQVGSAVGQGVTAAINSYLYIMGGWY